MNSLSRIGVYYRDTRASLFYLRAYDFFFFFLVELKVIKKIVTIASRGEAVTELEGYVSSKSKKK